MPGRKPVAGKDRASWSWRARDSALPPAAGVGGGRPAFRRLSPASCKRRVVG